MDKTLVQLPNKDRIFSYINDNQLINLNISEKYQTN